MNSNAASRRDVAPSESAHGHLADAGRPRASIRFAMFTQAITSTCAAETSRIESGTPAPSRDPALPARSRRHR